MTLASLRGQIGIVQQDVFLFGGTIRDNITYGRLEADEADIVEAARRARLAPMIAALPEGLDTVVGERGVKLSGGQKQRLAIARVFPQEPADSHPGRGHVGVRYGHRERNSAFARRARRWPDHVDHRASARHDPERRPTHGGRRNPCHGSSCTSLGPRRLRGDGSVRSSGLRRVRTSGARAVFARPRHRRRAR